MNFIPALQFSFHLFVYLALKLWVCTLHFPFTLSWSGSNKQIKNTQVYTLHSLASSDKIFTNVERKRRSWQYKVCGLRDPGLAQRVFHLQHLQGLHGRQGFYSGEIVKQQKIWVLNLLNRTDQILFVQAVPRLKWSKNVKMR